MVWTIHCCNNQCKERTRAYNIVDLINRHCDENGWLRCASCKGKGYIKKSYALQEPGEKWKPLIKGIVRFGKEGDTYQPFANLIAYKPTDDPTDIQFCYYKDLRPEGRLKTGHGPGGTPVFNNEQIVQLVKTLVTRGCLDASKVRKVLNQI